MGFLGLFEARAKTPLRIPTGCFSLDPEGRVISSTLPSTFPVEVIDEIGQTVLRTFQEAHRAGLGLSEVSAHYASLRITARDLHGGALIFLNPLMMSTPENVKS
ncbi:MAG: hypothetical protein MUE94_10230 [Verrucomicrobia bacterium]|jgi:hypothetical protein|nr:hypothetical protein [Verrucomicrobiota bacterium]